MLAIKDPPLSGSSSGNPSAPGSLPRAELKPRACRGCEVAVPVVHDGVVVTARKPRRRRGCEGRSGTSWAPRVPRSVRERCVPADIRPGGAGWVASAHADTAKLCERPPVLMGCQGARSRPSVGGSEDGGVSGNAVESVNSSINPSAPGDTSRAVEPRRCRRGEGTVATGAQVYFLLP